MIGHNGPPVHLTRREFRNLVVEKLETKTDVLVGHTLEYLMDAKGRCTASVAEIMRLSRIKKKTTVLESLARIAERIGLIIDKKNGRKNHYFTPKKADKPVPLKGTALAEPVPFNGTGQPVPSNGTGTVKPVSFNGTGLGEPVPLKGTGSRARISEYNKYNNINNNNTHTAEKLDRSVGVCENLPEGFEPLGHGAIINCETISHPSFSISIPSVQMQLEMTPGCHEEDARKWCKSFALQWAAEIENGKQPYAVLPANINRAIASSITRKVRHQENDDARAAKFKKSTDREKIQALIGGKS